MLHVNYITIKLGGFFLETEAVFIAHLSKEELRACQAQSLTQQSNLLIYRILGGGCVLG